MEPWDPQQLEFNRDEFSGVVRLFPVPNLVVFPHVMQPLHIFEERYREMLEDALHDDQLIAMALLAPGWEHDYVGRPKLLPWACLGKVVTHHRLDDGRYNLLLVGLTRVKLVEELAPLRSFRQARVEIVDDVDPKPSTASRQAARDLLDKFRVHLSNVSASDALQKLLAEGVPLSILTDLIAYALPMSYDLKHQLLVEPRALRRAELLSAHLAETKLSGDAPGESRVFPPPFSAN